MTEPAPASPAPAGKAKPKEQSSIKETIESILVAFILAFIFRAFLVEAFVIPTGSMAPTLKGAHMRFRCNDCGYHFDTNYSPAPNSNGDLVIPPASPLTYQVYCPNCGYKIPLLDPNDPDNDSTQPPVSYGDRILVLKYLYLFEPPRCWDVVVFKSPAPDDERTIKPSYQQNYIKRLIGTPGESVMILDGDIYKGKPAADLTSYHIQTKPPYAQDALWRVIYDNDYYAHGRERPDGNTWKQPWTIRAGTGWRLGDSPRDGRVFTFNNPAGDSTIFFDRNANPSNHGFTDWLAYDMDSGMGANVVHDLKLAFFYRRTAGEGPLRITLSDGRQSFAAVLSPTQAKLLEVSRNGEREIASAPLPHTNDPLRVEFTNVDYQVTLRVNDKDLAHTSSADYHPDIARLLEDYKDRRSQPWPSVDVAAANQTATFSHIGLWRDVYYLNRDSRAPNMTASPQNVANLAEDEYFVLGDNSLVSSDARYWTIPVTDKADRLDVPAGRVPGRFLLGRAFFVYWPAGFRPFNVPVALAPNFGDMRFIR